MAAAQPGFIAAYRAGAQRARDASCVDGAGNSTHTAVQRWGAFTVVALRVAMLRPLDPLRTTLERKLQEVDFVEAYAWWLVTQTNVNTESAWSYVCTVNAWHDRATGVGLAGGMSLGRVKRMLDGMQRLTGSPIARLRRVGVRPAHLASGIRLGPLRPASDPADANYAALMETALVAIARAGELAASRPASGFLRNLHPSRADVRFKLDAAGRPVECTLWIVNCKAKGAERFRRLPVYLPMHGAHLSPGWALWHLTEIIDPVPLERRAVTPLFRVPSTNAVLSVAQVRAKLRLCMAAIGRDASSYGAHSLRIGGATALAWLRVPGERIQCAGRWHSDAYLAYIRERRAETLSMLTQLAGADTDDFEADFVDIDLNGFDADDYD
jgi:hypothetical protein